MIYVLAIAITILLVAFITSPVRHPVRASRPYATVTKRPSGRWLTFGLAVDETGRTIETSGRFIGHITGSSMVKHGLSDGSTVVADFLSHDERRNLKHGDVVVVRDRHKEAHVKSDDEYCLRSVRSVADGVVDYEDDATGPHEQHPVDQMVAIVTRVVPTQHRRNTRFFGGQASA